MSLAPEIKRVVAPFEVVSPYQPAGDQPKAIAELTERVENGEKDIVLWVPPAPVNLLRRHGWSNLCSALRLLWCRIRLLLLS